MLGAVSMFKFKAVAFKMLPYDNKSELQVVIDMPEGTDLFVTANLAHRLGEEMRKIPRSLPTRPMSGPRRRSTSTAWCGIISCAASRGRATSRCNCSTRTSAAAPAMRSRLRAPDPDADRGRVQRAADGRRSAARAAGAGADGDRALRPDAGGPPPGGARPDRHPAQDAASGRHQHLHGGAARQYRVRSRPAARGDVRRVGGGHQPRDHHGDRRLRGRAVAAHP